MMCSRKHGPPRGTKRKAEDEGEHQEATRQDGMVVSCLRVESRRLMTRTRTRWMFQLRKTTSRSWEKCGTWGGIEVLGTWNSTVAWPRSGRRLRG